MIKTITATNYLGNSLELDLWAPEKTGLAVKSITGLGPSKASINVTDISTNDGALFNSGRVQKRNIVISVLFLEVGGKSVEDARLLLYKYFPIKRKLRLTFKMDNRTAYIDGYVESNEVTMFGENQKKLTAGTQLSIICPDPYFYSVKEQITQFSNTVSMFEFPFENNDPIESLIEMGNTELLRENTVYYQGDADAGITLHAYCTGNVVNLNIYNIETREVMKIDTAKIEQLTGKGLIKGDEVVICTIRGRKYMHLVREGVTTNIINCLDKHSNWSQISKGDNLFSFTADYGETNVNFRIVNNIIYEGV